MCKHVFFVFFACTALAAAAEFSGKTSNWHGFDSYEFEVGGRPCRTVVPKHAAEGNPWAWRAVFWGGEPQTEIALLKHGFHLAFIQCSDLLASPKNIEERNAFYKELTEKYGLAKKPVLIGMSRGGLCALRWAIANPDNVACLYLDAPVCDFKSWPGGKGKGKYSPDDWKNVLQTYNLTEEEALTFKSNPVDAFAPLAERKVPIISVCGDIDEVVPFDENTKILAERYKNAAAPFEVILKPNNKHHPHSLKDPKPIVDFILRSVPGNIPMPGIQVVQSAALPASTSIWNPAKKSGNIGEPRPIDTAQTDTVRYWLFLPADYEKQAASGGAPLLLFLHGAGERGSNINKVKDWGPPMLLDTPEFREHFPCVTVSPQCKNGYTWSPAQLMLLLDEIEKCYKIDKSRIYVTGLSMGGFGTWMCLNESPQRFAAAVPVCSGAKTRWAKNFTDIPVWNFHGDKDPVVPIAKSEEIVKAVQAAGGKKIIFTTYAGGVHNVWSQTYSSQLLYDWLFAHRRD
ncbi:MAG: prolyl oligopeptidase family serine peptidase [Planctomycetaceae bacterium]|jgi:pimeloyl-ACP methyl ester carboxylesterase|nr:prolyl oligopeptidase family serine peptidase [Planctomycetaceae bacterium]